MCNQFDATARGGFMMGPVDKKVSAAVGDDKRILTAKFASITIDSSTPPVTGGGKKVVPLTATGESRTAGGGGVRNSSSSVGPMHLLARTNGPGQNGVIAPAEDAASNNNSGVTPTAASSSLEADEVAPATCDACPDCPDVCPDPFCPSCAAKRRTRADLDARAPCCARSSNPDNVEARTYTSCQVRRHDHADSAWLVVGDGIYDATPYVNVHPGGMKSILRRSGGKADCTTDMEMHSRGAVKKWKKRRVGTLVDCPGGERATDAAAAASRDDVCGGSPKQCVVS